MESAVLLSCIVPHSRQNAVNSLHQQKTLILTFHRLNGEGHIDLTIEQLTLGTAPPGCEYNGGFCALNFRFCVDAVDDHFVDTFVADRPFCNILYANFSVVVHGERPYSDRFAVDAPSGVIHQRRFDVTSPMAPVNYGNIFKYRLKATCSAGFVGALKLANRQSPGWTRTAEI
uniref:Uncharacterized protein n=1 Tax=Globodera rostochiensis TaxID=31243 RepID=A0A914HGR8_GLORO